ncbi:MAG: amidohydrolase, partial [Ilumatobacteraceae bacterium]
MTDTYVIGPTNTDLLEPEPEKSPVHYTLISVDDHLVEPRHLFEGRMPAHLADAAPKVVTNDAHQELWQYEDVLYPQIGLNAISGRPKDQWNMEPARFDEMRRGCWDVEARVADMDLDGVQASLCFPSLIAGFAGTVFSQSKDQELGLACVRAWNDWHVEEWA